MLGRRDVVPREKVVVLTRRGDKLVVRFIDARADLFAREDLNRIDRDDAAAKSVHLGVEARRAVAHAQDPG